MTAARIDPHAAFLSENELQNQNYENKMRETGFKPISDITLFLKVREAGVEPANACANGS